MAVNDMIIEMIQESNKKETIINPSIEKTINNMKNIKESHKGH